MFIRKRQLRRAIETKMFFESKAIYTQSDVLHLLNQQKEKILSNLLNGNKNKDNKKW